MLICIRINVLHEICISPQVVFGRVVSGLDVLRQMPARDSMKANHQEHLPPSPSPVAFCSPSSPLSCSLYIHTEFRVPGLSVSNLLLCDVTAVA